MHYNYFPNQNMQAMWKWYTVQTAKLLLSAGKCPSTESQKLFDTIIGDHTWILR